MSDINAQIDAAVVLMKARAAEFDTRREMGLDETFEALTDRAIANLSRVFHGDGSTTEVLDTMNLCALALSVLPRALERHEVRGVDEHGNLMGTDPKDKRIAGLEAENETLVETQRRKVVLLLGDRGKAEAALAERDKEIATIQWLVREAIAATWPVRPSDETIESEYQELLGDALRARAEEESEK